MKIFDTTNPSIVATALNATVKIQQGVIGTPLTSTAKPQVDVSASNGHMTIAVNANRLYIPIPEPSTINLAGVVANDVVKVLGITYTCVAAGAVAQQFNVGGTDAITATNLAAAINAYYASATLAGEWFECSGSIAPSFQANGKTSAGAGTATIVIDGSNDGINPALPVLMTLSVTMTDNTKVYSQSNAILAQYSFIRARLTALTGTGATAQAYLDI